MRLPSLILLTLVAVFALSGCESAKKAFGGNKSAPDEFVVYSRPPLSQPPDFSLRPPTPGVARPQSELPADIARDALLGTDNSSRQRLASVRQDEAATPGLQALMKNTGATDADPDIRRKIDEETSILAEEDQRLVDKMIFWVDDKPFQGTVLDPQKEQQRIREAQALGKPVTEGSTKHIKSDRDKKGLLEF
ncbi:MAG: DUF3035 domain-containing protein [Rhodospirillales bacterium]|nr:DUF3035 domain-containing protein [Rhodospirillales bacterium]